MSSLITINRPVKSAGLAKRQPHTGTAFVFVTIFWTLFSKKQNPRSANPTAMVSVGGAIVIRKLTAETLTNCFKPSRELHHHQPQPSDQQSVLAYLKGAWTWRSHSKIKTALITRARMHIIYHTRVSLLLNEWECVLCAVWLCDCVWVALWCRCPTG